MIRRKAFANGQRAANPNGKDELGKVVFKSATKMSLISEHPLSLEIEISRTLYKLTEPTAIMRGEMALTKAYDENKNLWNAQQPFRAEENRHGFFSIWGHYPPIGLGITEDDFVASQKNRSATTIARFLNRRRELASEKGKCNLS